MAPIEASHMMGPPLTFAEVRALVESASSAVRLELDGGMEDGGSDDKVLEACANIGQKDGGTAGCKGRYLVARRALAAGEIVIGESPLFRGSTDGAQSRKAYTEDFLALARAAGGSEAGEEEAEDDGGDHLEEDALHPQSPLVDCIAGIVVAKREALHGLTETDRARAKLRVRRLAALHRSVVPEAVPKGCARDIFGVLTPELQALTSEEELNDFLHVLSSNRFGTADSDLELMFAASMFEHSCAPSCFLGECGCTAESVRTYRALRDVAEGEALSIDYLLLPDGYAPASSRAELLSRWGFECTCPRCTVLPELTRAFVCPACGMPELCPRRPGPEVELVCRACGREPDAAYRARCLAREAEVRAGSLDGDFSEQVLLGSLDSGTEPIGRFHNLAFDVRWAYVAGGLDPTCGLAAYRIAVEALIECIARLYGNPRHPQLLDLYHIMAELDQGNLTAQRHHLELEHAVLVRCYPEEAARQDAEVMAMVQGRGSQSASDDTQLGAMD